MVVAGYRLDRILGQGGMGVVYEATQLSLDRTVALKIVAPGVSADATFRARFRREGLIQARLEHPNIVTVYEAGEFEGTLFLAMRLVRGSSLKELVERDELDSVRSLRILEPVADALDSAHEAGLIHRDVKPHNILVGARDHPFLADFGITTGPDATGFTRTGEFLGSLDYISPEQIRGEAATSASDVYALGAVLFECLAGVVPYPRESEAAVLYAHVAQTPPHVTERRPALPAELDAVLAHAMAKEPSERPATAGELIREAKRVFDRTTRRAMQMPELPVPPPEAAIDPVTAEPPEPGAAQLGESDGELTLTPSELAPTPPEKHLAAPPLAAPPVTTPTAASQPVKTPPVTTSPVTTSPVATPPVTTPGVTRPPAATPTAATPPVARPPVTRSPFAAPTAPGPASSQIRRRRAVAIFSVAIVVVIAGGFAIGHSGTSHGSTAVPSRAATAGHVELTAPAAWKPPAQAPSIPGLSVTQELAREDHSSDGVMFAGLLPGAGGVRLLPPAFLAKLQKAPSVNDTVHLGDASAYRYRDLDVSGLAKPLTLLVSPTTAGVVGIGCLAPAGAGSAFLASCEKAAGTLRLNGAQPLGLGPNPAYASVLTNAVTGLRAARPTAEALASARTRAGQASLSGRLAQAQAAAAAKLSAAKPGPDAANLNAALIGALRGTAAGYNAMSRAAAAGQGGAYGAARSKTARELTAVSEELAALRAAGYGT
jgi:serine/threonine protein kinase